VIGAYADLLLPWRAYTGSMTVFVSDEAWDLSSGCPFVGRIPSVEHAGDPQCSGGP